jgi:hypothetical protein
MAFLPGLTPFHGARPRRPNRVASVLGWIGFKVSSFVGLATTAGAPAGASAHEMRHLCTKCDSDADRNQDLVIAGLDPAIHQSSRIKMDARVNPSR